jgi:hypothetical protein
MKNRTRESCTSGSVRDEDGNILIYSAPFQQQIRLRCKGVVNDREVLTFNKTLPPNSIEERSHYFAETRAGEEDTR